MVWLVISLAPTQSEAGSDTSDAQQIGISLLWTYKNSNATTAIMQPGTEAMAIATRNYRNYNTYKISNRKEILPAVVICRAVWWRQKRAYRDVEIDYGNSEQIEPSVPSDTCRLTSRQRSSLEQQYRAHLHCGQTWNAFLIWFGYADLRLIVCSVL